LELVFRHSFRSTYCQVEWRLPEELAATAALQNQEHVRHIVYIARWTGSE